MCVAFLPFPGAIVGHHTGAPLAALLFAGAGALTGVVAWALAARVGGRASARRQLAIPVVFLASAPFAPLVVSIRGTDVSLAPVLLLVGLVAARVVLERSAARAPAA